MFETSAESKGSIFQIKVSDDNREISASIDITRGFIVYHFSG